MVDRFQTFDGDANLFSGLNEDGDKFVLLRNLEGYDTPSEFVFLKSATWPNRRIELGEGNDSIVLMDSDGMFVEFSGDKLQINSLFNCIPKPIIEEAKQEAEQNLVEYVAGPAGPKGDQGYAGADGRDGADGLPGKDGKDGKDGIDGKDGKDGKDGIDGKDGKDGIDGKDGLPGKDGADGKDGIDGKDGKDGIDGKDGADGKDGLPGKDGADGKDGVDGKDGLPGKEGPQGLRGLDGKDGVDGKDGIDGKDGEQGPQGEIGPQGEQGEKGDTGDTGVASATYPLQIAEDGTLTIDKKFIEQLAKASKGGKIVMQGGGGNLTAVMADGNTVNKDARHINFTGAGVSVTKGNRGQVNISIPGGDVDGGFTVSRDNSQGTINNDFFDTDDDIFRLKEGNGIDIGLSRPSSNVVQYSISVAKTPTPSISPSAYLLAGSANTSSFINEAWMSAFEENLDKGGGQVVDGGEL